MNHLGRTTLFTMLMIASASVLADDPVKLSKDEAKKTIEGKTLVYNAANGAAQRVYYGADGNLIGKGSGSGKSSQSAGEWKIDDDGKICVVIKSGPLSDRCYYLVRADGALSFSGNGTKPGIAFTVE